MAETAGPWPIANDNAAVEHGEEPVEGRPRARGGVLEIGLAASLEILIAPGHLPGTRCLCWVLVCGTARRWQSALSAI
jgi:hypothetical protein